MHDLYRGSSLLALLLALNGEAPLPDVSATLVTFIIAVLVRLPLNLQISLATFGSIQNHCHGFCFPFDCDSCPVICERTVGYGRPVFITAYGRFSKFYAFTHELISSGQAGQY